MRTYIRSLTAVAVLAGAGMTGIALAQGAATPAPPAGQAPAGGGTAGGERGGGGRGGGAGQPAQGGGPGRRGGFTQFTRPLAPQDVIVRGRSLYESTCVTCHANDLRGGPMGPNLLRSGVALRDQKGELVTAELAKHNPVVNLVDADGVAVAEYIHSILATTGGQGSPPGRNPTGLTLNVLVGDAKAGETYFGFVCAKCHSTTGDLAGIGSKFADARALQNAWVSGTLNTSGGGGFGRGNAGAGNPATITLANGTKIEGTLARVDDFLVTVVLPDKTLRTIARNNGVPKVEVKDPKDPHKKMILELDDAENKTLHDVTAFLATIK